LDLAAEAVPWLRRGAYACIEPNPWLPLAALAQDSSISPSSSSLSTSSSSSQAASSSYQSSSLRMTSATSSSSSSFQVREEEEKAEQVSFEATLNNIFFQPAMRAESKVKGSAAGSIENDSEGKSSIGSDNGFKSAPKGIELVRVTFS